MNFQEMLAHLAELTNDQIAELHSGLVEVFEEKRSEELSVPSVAELADLSDAIDKVTAEMSSRNQRREELQAKVNGLASKVEASAVELAESTEEPTEEATEELGDEAAAEAEVPEAEIVETGADLSPTGLSDGVDPVELGVWRGAASITAGADIPGMSAGTELADVTAIAEAMMQRRRSFRGVAAEGNGDRVIVASVRGEYPEERRLGTDLGENMDKINDVISPEAVTAAGGLCAPLEPYYGIQVISQASRPVRDALANFGADRGGVRFLPPPVLADLSGAIGITTESEDAAGYGTGPGERGSAKPCLHVTCGTEQTVTIDAIHRCLTFGNFAARTYPEQVEAWISLSLSAHARVAETKLLDAISAECTQVTAANTYSAIRSLLPQIDAAVAGYRSRHRASDNLRLHVMLPSWVKELLRADLARGFREDLDPLSVSDAQIVAWFTMRNVSVSWYIDTETGKGQQFGAQSAGALLGFPSTVRWYLYVEGSFVFLDGGTLDLGLVRDSSLNSVNDYQIFAETFEAVAFFGIEALAITSTVTVDGVHSPAATASP